MKVITIQQPWATLIIIGAKCIETRSWATKYRGPILIHASAGMPKMNRLLCVQEPFSSCLNGIDHLPTGAIIGRATLKEVYSTDHLLGCFEFNPAIYAPHEKEFGDYSSGRYGWLLDNIVPFERPIPAKGQLGLWNYPDELLKGKF